MSVFYWLFFYERRKNSQIAMVNMESCILTVYAIFGGAALLV